MWTDVLADAERVLRMRLPRAGAEDDPLQGIATMTGLARRSAEPGGLGQMATSLGYCEMPAMSLRPWHQHGRTFRGRPGSDAGSRRIVGVFPQD